MIHQPLASVIIPAYNAENYIEKTLDSILSNGVEDIECLIIDDGSTDNTAAIVKRLAEKETRIRLFQQANSGGPAGPRNKGVREARSNNIFIFDSDDLMLPGKISFYLDVAKKYDGGFIFSNFQTINEQDEIIQSDFLSHYQSFRKITSKISENLYFLDHKKIKNELIKANFIGTSGVFLNKKMITSAVIFDENLKSGDDLLAWLKLSESLNVIFIDKVFHAYRKRENSISTSNFPRLVANKINVLNQALISNCNEDQKNEINIKINGYLYSLGYYYRKSRNLLMSVKTFLRMKGIKGKLRGFIESIKSCIVYIIFR